MTTIHSYTGDQPTLDTFHKDLYRAARRALNIDPDLDRRRQGDRPGHPRPQGQARRHLDPRADAERLAGRLQVRRQAPDHQPRRVNKAISEAADGRPAQGHPRRHRGAAGLVRLQPRSAFVDLRASTRPRSSTAPSCRVVCLVRQRMGLLEPHGRHRGRHGQADLRSCGEAAMSFHPRARSPRVGVRSAPRGSSISTFASKTGQSSPTAW